MTADVYRVLDRRPAAWHDAANRRIIARAPVRMERGRRVGPWWALAALAGLGIWKRARSPRGRWQVEWEGCYWAPRALTRAGALRLARRHMADPAWHEAWAAEKRADRDARNLT